MLQNLQYVAFRFSKKQSRPAFLTDQKNLTTLKNKNKNKSQGYRKDFHTVTHYYAILWHYSGYTTTAGPHSVTRGYLQCLIKPRLVTVTIVRVNNRSPLDAYHQNFLQLARAKYTAC